MVFEGRLFNSGCLLQVRGKVDSFGRVINTHIFSIQVFPFTRATVRVYRSS